MPLKRRHRGSNDAPAGMAGWVDPRCAGRRLGSILDLPAGWRLRGVRVARVYPARPAGIGIEYDLLLRGEDGREVHGAVYASPADLPPGRDSRSVRIRPGSAFGLVGLSHHLAGEGIALHTPDRDARLPFIPVAALTARRGGESGPTPVESRLGMVRRPRCACLSYRPGRRCTLAYQGTGPDRERFYVGKLYHNGISARTPALARALARELRAPPGDDLQTPRVVARWPDLNMVVFEGLAQEAPGPDSQHEPLQRASAAGRFLTRLRRLSFPGLPRFTPADEIAVVERWLRVTEDAGRPTTRPRRLLDRLRRRVARLPRGRRCTVHRDYYDAQLLRTADGWGVLDLDTAALGHPEIDVGNYLAHLAWASLRRTGHAGHAPAAGAFLDACGGLARLDLRLLQFYLSTSLLRIGLIHSLRSGTERTAPRLFHVARACLDPAPGRLPSRWMEELS
jgi:hypothetical protein